MWDREEKCGMQGEWRIERSNMGYSGAIMGYIGIRWDMLGQGWDVLG